ncbi:Phospholipase D1 [Rhodotorula kratochvilovae]
MDFSDVVHRALAQKQRDSSPPAPPPRGSTSPDSASLSTNSTKHVPPPLSLPHPASGGASPAARDRDASPAPRSPSSSPTHRQQHHPAPAHPLALVNGAAHKPHHTSARSSPATSRSPSRRTTADEYLLPPIPSHAYSPPSSPPHGPSPSSSLGLGLDTPRPRHRSQASFAWFADTATGPPALGPAARDDGGPDAQGFFPPSSAAGGAPAAARRTESPARMDLSRSSSISTTNGGGAASGAGARSPLRISTASSSRTSSFGPSAGAGSASSNARAARDPKPRRRQSRPGPAQPTSPVAEESAGSGGGGGGGTASDGSDAEGGRPPRSPLGRPAHPTARNSRGRQGSGESSGSGSGSLGLRGAFTASDLERGARRLRGEEDVPDAAGASTTTAAGAGKSEGPRARRGAGALQAAQALKTAAKRKTAGAVGRGAKLERPKSAGAAEGPASGIPAHPSSTAAAGAQGEDGVPRSGQTTPARPRSMLLARETSGAAAADEWADETRDQFDVHAPARPGAAGAASRKGSLWGTAGTGGFFPHHHRPGGGTGSGSGASTPREPASEDEGAGGGGGGAGAGVGAKRPLGARRGSAWNVVRNRLGGVQPKKKKEKQGASLTGHELVAELATGALPLVLVKMATMDRDEKGDKRIPILMNYLKLRITDSVYPFHDKHAIFRIELEYGDSAVKWVIYRELKDFVNLHAHYRVANLRQGIDKFPAFPKTSLPYLNWLKSEGRGNVGKAEFARMQREALENYLLKLIRATMFGAGANRLCKFLEISAMSIQLATRGGEQGKQGYLRVTSSGASRRKQPGFHPISWKKRHEPKWFIVRDSYIVAVESPASTEVFDVIMVDSTFEIERPTRVYRKGMNLLHANGSSDSLSADEELRAGAVDLLANEPKPPTHRGVADPHDPSTTNPKSASDEDAGEGLKNSSTHTFYLRSSERKLRLVAKTERQQDQFIASIEKMLAKTIWAGRNRFDSFAPIRLNVAAQWLIDGRDYFWSFIHDWWLSPELYLRRPAIKNEKWRLDRLLQRKAREGVQIFVIVYKEVSNDFTPVDSTYTKTRLRGLHPNIHVQRSPSHTSTGTLLWSHHEKMCVIDETIGFMGGLDLCFGRWDTPGHVLVDDGPNPLKDGVDPKTVSHEDAARSQIWPGKDYSNQRVLDFHTLSKPDEDMYDRSKVPRQPWHDIGLQIIGQPARDLCRHFMQRWNYLLRTKNHSVKMPFLIPAPDFTPEQLQSQRITGTCEVQICRSVGPWSMGISHIEHSIQNAYIKAIQLSDHFVYIENQFFVTSTECEGTVIENKIGDALVSRIVRAHSEGTPWRAVVVVPLIPGYPYPLDHSEASSVRLIMECQFRTICRGEYSIFARLRREGIDPDEYITFFGLRAWGKLGNGALTTESTYIHAKGMIVDDRIAIIGSANINERSQRGDRDSELACIIRDTDMLDSTMAGKPYQVGRFAHTMRVRLMREHLGIDVDELESSEGREELEAHEADHIQHRDEEWDPDHQQSHGTNRGAKAGKTGRFIRSAVGSTATYASGVASGAVEAAGLGLQKSADRVTSSLKVGVDKREDKPPSAVADDEETNADRIVQGQEGTQGFASSVVPTIEEKVMVEQRPRAEHREEHGARDQRRQPAQREREEGPTTRSPAQQREADEEARGDPGAQVPQQNGGDKLPSEEHPQRSREGEETTQSNPDIDDTRKLPMSDPSEEGAAPLSPIDEDGPDDRHGKAEQEIKVDPAPPDSEYDPPDIAHAHQGYRALDQDGKQGDKGVDRKPTRRERSEREGSEPLGNEQAVNRNAITSTLRRNLRERGAYTIPTAAPKVDPYGFADPLVDSFYKDVWLAAAARNTQIYRKVFRCMPDDLVQTWKQYREFQNWAERHNKAPKNVVPSGDEPPHSNPAGHSGQHGAGGGGSGGGAMGQGKDEGGQTMDKENSSRGTLDQGVHVAAGKIDEHMGVPGFGLWTRGGDITEKEVLLEKGLGAYDDARNASGDKLDVPPAEGIERSRQRGSTISRRARSSTVAASEDSSATAVSGGNGGAGEKDKKGRGRSSTLAGGNSKDGGDKGSSEGHDHDEAFPEEERKQMEALLEEVTGQLVVFPTRFLEAESAGGNFLFSKDRIPPMAIYD